MDNEMETGGKVTGQVPLVLPPEPEQCGPWQGKADAVAIWVYRKNIYIYIHIAINIVSPIW